MTQRLRIVILSFTLVGLSTAFLLPHHFLSTSSSFSTPSSSLPSSLLCVGHGRCRTTRPPSPICRFAAKGFGNTPPPPSPSKKSKTNGTSTATTGTASATGTTNTAPTTITPTTRTKTTTTTTTTTTEERSILEEGSSSSVVPSQSSDLSQGKAALAKLRRQKAEQRNEELRKLKEVQQVDAMVRESPEAAAIPERVAQRMGARMLPFVGIPLFAAMGSFVGFWYMATYRDMEFQPALVATTSLVLLAVGLVGITYSIMSASWDPDREGSVLGTDEFSQNLNNIKTGLSRSRENAVLREKMDKAVFSQEELDTVVDSEKKKEPKKSFTEKMGDELK